MTCCQTASFREHLAWAHHFEFIPVIKGLLFETLIAEPSWVDFQQIGAALAASIRRTPPRLPPARQLLDLTSIPESDQLHCCSRNAATFDGLYYDSSSRDILLLQITVNKSHEIKDTGLYEI